jgi:hypothetical protein
MRALEATIADLTGQVGRRVDVVALNISDRRGELPLAPPGLWSPNRACRLIQAADGWIALNLAREEDRDLIAAWLQADVGDDVWAAIPALARGRPVAELLEDGGRLSLPVARVGETVSRGLEAPLIRQGDSVSRWRGDPLRVIDLSALWAGPLCGAILAAMGAAVTKVESVRRPDPTRGSTPAFFRRLNGAKADLSLDLARPDGQARLRDEIAAADVLITSARPRALPSLGLDMASVFAGNPGLVWVAITGHGWSGEAAARVAFGDDAAAAGGLVRWTPAGGPRFLGDALADPVTGLSAAVAALRGLIGGGGVLADVSLAGSAAGAAEIGGLKAAA